MAFGEAGTCQGGYLDPPQNLEGYCNCDPLTPFPWPEGSENDGYGATAGQGIGGSGNTSLQPGAQVHLTATLPASFTLAKLSTSAQVSLQQAAIDVQISSTTDALGKSRFTVTGGNGQFAPYVFGAQLFGASTFSVERGFGWIHWADGRLHAKLRVRVSLTGFPDVVAVAAGTGSANLGNNTMTFDADALAIESVSVPALNLVMQTALVALFLATGIWLVRKKSRGPSRRRTAI